MKKNSKLIINISSEDKAILKKRAEMFKMNLSNYALFILMNATPKVENNTSY